MERKKKRSEDSTNEKSKTTVAIPIELVYIYFMVGERVRCHLTLKSYVAIKSGLLNYLDISKSYT